MRYSFIREHRQQFRIAALCRVLKVSPSGYFAALAWQNEYYIVSATMDRASRVYDITGDVIAESGMWQPWAEATLHLGKRLFEIDFNLEALHKLEQKYGRRALVQWYHDDDWFTLASLDPEVSVEEWMAEFGLVPLRPYHARCEKAQDEARARCGK